MKNNQRSRNYALISYLDLDTLLSALKNNPVIRHYAFIEHNLDTNDDGTFITSHYHVLINLNNALSLSTVRNLFPKEDKNGVLQNTLGQVIYDKSSAFTYLTHEDINDENKHLYDKSLIVSDNINVWTREVMGNAPKDSAYDIIEDMLNKTSLHVMLARYGRDFVIHYEKYRDFAYMIEDEKKRFKMLTTDESCSFY